MGNGQVSTRPTLSCVVCLLPASMDHLWPGPRPVTQLQGTKGSELMIPRLVRTIGQKDGGMGALSVTLGTIDAAAFLTLGEGTVDGRGSPLFLPGPPGHCCKIPNRLMANGQSMLRAQAGAAANENLDATAPGRERAWGAGAGCQTPTPAGFSLAPSEPVSAGPQHLGRGAERPGRPGPASSILDGMLFQGSKRTQGADEARMPT